MNPAKLMGTRELATRAGVTPRQIDHWASVGWIKEQPRKKGTGNKRAFNPTEVRITQLIGLMVKAGIAPSAAAHAARTGILEADQKGFLLMAELIPWVAVSIRVEV